MSGDVNRGEVKARTVGPGGALRYRADRLEMAGVDLEELADACGTPLFVYDFDQVAEQVGALRQALEPLDPLIAYAVKANSNVALLDWCRRLGCGFDIVSGGELYRTQQIGCPGERVIFSGVGKSATEIGEALKGGVLMICVESAQELERIARVASDLGCRAPIALRINPAIDPKTHPYIATGIETSKFGLWMDEVEALYQSMRNHPHLEPVGISAHIGSQILDLQPFSELVAFMRQQFERLRERGVRLRYVDIGGGFGITYRDEQPPALQAYAEVVKRGLEGLPAQLILEPGRCLVGNAGVLLSSVHYTKRNGQKHFVILDAGMGDLLRPALYGAYHEILPLRDGSRPTVTRDWVGPICESGDFIAKERSGPQVESGERVALCSAGAYSFVMASNYNSRPRPAEVAVSHGRWQVIKEREKREDLLVGEREKVDWLPGDHYGGVA